MLGKEIDNDIPPNDEFRYFYGKEDYKIHFKVQKDNDLNSPEYLQYIEMQIAENLKTGEGRPSVQLHTPPSKTEFLEEEEELGLRRVDEERRTRLFGRK
jgi:hypothetical protein